MKTTTAFIFILISLGLFYTFLSPHYEKVKSLQAESTQYSDVLDNVGKLTQKRDELLIKYNAIPKAEVERINKALPDNTDTVRLALDFDTIASKYGITIKNISTENKPQGSGEAIVPQGDVNPYETTTVRFSFISNYDNFRKFMKDMESSLRILDVKSISFQASDTGLNDYNIVIQTYWLK